MCVCVRAHVCVCVCEGGGSLSAMHHIHVHVHVSIVPSKHPWALLVHRPNIGVSANTEKYTGTPANHRIIKHEGVSTYMKVGAYSRQHGRCKCV